MSNYFIMSWNVSGYRDSIHEWLLNFVNKEPDIIFLNETKKSEKFLLSKFKDFTNYNFIINSHVPSHIHGVAMLIHKRNTYKQIYIEMNIPVRSDSKSNDPSKGRIICIELNNHLNIIGTYTPNSGRRLEKLQYRTEIWDPEFFKLLESFNNHTLWIGDINVALTDSDVSNPKLMKRYAGFTEKERNNFSNLIKTEKWFDIWRYQHPNEIKYTWRSSINGMRLDNIIVSKSLVNYVIDSFMISEVSLSDHIPVCVIINRNL